MEKKIKATLRIATKQQYCYIEVALEGTAEEIVSEYLRISETYVEAQREFDKLQKANIPPF